MGEGSTFKITYQSFIIKHSNDSQDPRRLQDQECTTSPVRNSLYHLFHTSLWMGPLPPPVSTSRPLDVIHVIGVPRPSLFFTTLITQTKEQRTGEPWKRGYLFVSSHCTTCILKISTLTRLFCNVEGNTLALTSQTCLQLRTAIKYTVTGVCVKLTQN